MFLSKRWI